MFGFFEQKYDNPALAAEIRQTQERWFVFLEKLEARMNEMCTAAVPELKIVFEADTDPYKRAHGRMLSGLLGQLHQIRDKANDVREQQISGLIYSANTVIPNLVASAGRPWHDMLHTFREACFNRHRHFEAQITHYTTLLKEAAGQQDLEAFYNEQLAEFELTRNTFRCKQCGGNIAIPRMFFIATYITCGYCQTQNTFLPSTGAQLLLHQARSLAEQRTAHLLKAYENSHPKDPALYKQYLRSMFDEWNRIVPDMATENEKFYQRLLEDYNIDHF